MDYIKGQNLGDCWKYLTKYQKNDVICQTAIIIKQLQSISIPTAGPLGGGPCRGKFFTDYGAGPFNSGAEIEAWFNHKLKICKDYNQAPQDTPLFNFQKFVLVHQDISPRNMILNAAGNIYLIDWAHAGAYPPAFERAAIVEQYRFPEFNEMILHVMPEYQNTTLRCGNCSQFGMDYQLPVSHNHPLLSLSIESAVTNNLHRILQDKPAGVESRQNIPLARYLFSGVCCGCTVSMEEEENLMLFFFFPYSIYLNCSLNNPFCGSECRIRKYD